MSLCTQYGRLNPLLASVQKCVISASSAPASIVRSAEPDTLRALLQLPFLGKGFRGYAANPSIQAADVMDAPMLEVPGGAKIPFAATCEFVNPFAAQRIPVYRTIDGAGKDVPEADIPHPVNQDKGTSMYKAMVTLQTMDTLFYEAQRQGRFSFYLTCQGEEATNIGAAAALDNTDMVFAQYREHGVLLWRGYSLLQFANQLLGNAHEPGKGRQMPIHYGSPEHCYQTISSPLATQMPHAVGAAYALKLQGKLNSVTAVFFGDGASSEGDAHAAFNFAAVLGAPVVFICRNNGYAISTPANEQYKGDGIAARGASYGMPAIRVDGGDLRAVYCAVAEARRLAVSSSGPVLVEAMSYRAGHHSTSDDSTKYRTSDEMRAWRARDPVARMRTWLVRQGWWDEARELELRRTVRQQVLEALDAAARVPKPPLSDMFTDVYHKMPWHLQEQQRATLQYAASHPQDVPPGVPVK